MTIPDEDLLLHGKTPWRATYLQLDGPQRRRVRSAANLGAKEPLDEHETVLAIGLARRERRLWLPIGLAWVLLIIAADALLDPARGWSPSLAGVPLIFLFRWIITGRAIRRNQELLEQMRAR